MAMALMSLSTASPIPSYYSQTRLMAWLIVVLVARPMKVAKQKH